MSKYNIIPEIDIPDHMIASWQKTIDLMAKVVNVPAGLVMRVHETEIEVFISSKSEGNVYEKGEKAPLNTGLYCETVMETEQQLLVPDALSDPNWQSNPDIELNMISYLGVPLLWPDGEIFGTVCVLDTKVNSYSQLYIDLVTQFKDAVQLGLATLFENQKLIRLQAELVQQAKLASIGELSACLAHEINQPLSVIGMTAEMGEDAINDLHNRTITNKENPAAINSTLTNSLTMFEKIGGEVERCSKIITHLKTFSGTGLSEFREKTKLTWLVEQALILFSHKFKGDDIRIESHFCDPNLEIDCDYVQIEQVLTNLISNACFSVNQNPANRSKTISINVLTDDDFIIIEIQDNGAGIAKDIINKIFDPFFTTKEPGQGTGLGLAISYSIIKAHAGKLIVENTQPVGCKFSLLFAKP